MTELLGREVFRPAVTLVAPGAVALSPWLWALFSCSASARSLFSSSSLSVSIGLMLACAAAGLVLEDVGTLIEVKVFDRLRGRMARDHESIWWKYLRTAFTVEPVGHRYLRDRLIRLKFELNMSVAVGIGLLGHLGVWYLFELSLSPTALLGSVAFGLYLTWEARCTTGLLADVRRHIVTEGIRTADVEREGKK